MNHTPLPWKVRALGDDCFVEGNEVVGSTIVGEYKREILSDEEYPLKKADAEFIVRACNSYYDLLDACKEFVRKVDCGEARSKRSYAEMKAAIAKAEGRL